MSRSCSPSAGSRVSYETIRCWTRKFGQLYAWNLRRNRCKLTGRWHLDEMVKVSGKRMWLWRAVDDEGEMLDVLLQKRRNSRSSNPKDPPNVSTPRTPPSTMPSTFNST